MICVSLFISLRRYWKLTAKFCFGTRPETQGQSNKTNIRFTEPGSSSENKVAPENFQTLTALPPNYQSQPANGDEKLHRISQTGVNECVPALGEHMAAETMSLFIRLCKRVGAIRPAVVQARPIVTEQQGKPVRQCSLAFMELGKQRAGGEIL